MYKYRSTKIKFKLDKIRFATKNVKDEAPWTYVIKDLNDEEFIGTFINKKHKRLSESKGCLNKPNI